MRLILIGSEYAGKTTLAKAVSRWMIESFDLPFVRWHNHWVVPYLDRHMVVWADEARTRPGKQLDEEWDAEELDQITAMKPSLLEQLTRHMIWRHLHPDMYREPDVLLIDGYYADAVYAPIYYGFGEPGSFANRRQRARAWDRELLAGRARDGPRAGHGHRGDHPDPDGFRPSSPRPIGFRPRRRGAEPVRAGVRRLPHSQSDQDRHLGGERR